MLEIKFNAPIGHKCDEVENCYMACFVTYHKDNAFRRDFPVMFSNFSHLLYIHYSKMSNAEWQ